MSLYTQWQELIDNQTNETFEAFWSDYSEAEIKIYTDILNKPTEKFSGKVGELIEKYQVKPELFFGFLDGIQGSLTHSIDLEQLTEDNDIILDIDLEKLFFNMLVADAEYLYTLPGWDYILTEEQKYSLTKDYKRSKIVVKEKTPGRNEPCLCGSGKKYKHCCGKN